MTENMRETMEKAGFKFCRTTHGEPLYLREWGTSDVPSMSISIEEFSKITKEMLRAADNLIQKHDAAADKAST